MWISLHASLLPNKMEMRRCPNRVLIHARAGEGETKLRQAQLGVSACS